ncbi:MAG: acyltransferase [Deltaproteobacteria bacterium]|nr:acyltransferase [Deltaproteobacteria bacterium]
METTPAPVPPAERQVRLDGLRAVAILLVMVHHFRHLPGCPEWLRWFGLRGYVGVDVFFVLSGWLVGGQAVRALRRDGRLDVRAFYLRRWMRTLPLYWAVALVLGAVGMLRLSTAWALPLFLQNYVAPADWLITWSLCVEEHFYLVLPWVAWGVYALGRRHPRVAVAAVVFLVALSPAWRWLKFDAMTHGSYVDFLKLFYVPTHLRLEGLVIGVACAAQAASSSRVWMRLCAHRSGAAVAGFALAVGSVWNPWLTGTDAGGAARMAFFSAVPQFLLVSAGVALMLPWGAERIPAAGWVARVSTWIAEHAYGAYLVHDLLRDPVQRALAPRQLPFWAVLFACFTASFAVAAGARFLVEKPGLKLRDRWLASRAARDG